MIDRHEWWGLVNARTDGPAEVVLSTIYPEPAGASFSSPFRVIGSDRADYFVKAVDYCPYGGVSVINEFVVAALGRLIDAPVVTTVLMEVPQALAGREVRPGQPLAAGLAHASKAIGRCDERRGNLESRSHDDNSNRQAPIYALFDWTVGSDQQWLHDIDDDRRIYSHDHGLYLPHGWVDDPSALVGVVDSANTTLLDPPAGLSEAAIDLAADRLAAVTRVDLSAILNRVPTSWPVTDAALETLGWFLERRITGVSQRTRNLTTAI